MGIPGLLTALKSVTYPVHISEYKGLTVGVDAYCWLHRGTFSCSTELCTNSDTDKYVTFCMKRVSLLRHNGAEPIMVFDGASLPMKEDKHLERRRQRKTSMVKGQQALAAGESGAAAQHFAKATTVTHQMAYELIKELRRAGVKIVVAPYEADAQLAHLSRTGAVDAVITEDSDYLPYGCKKVMFKMDNEGNGQEIQLRNLAANKPLSLCNWKNSMFLDLCLLVGCDYITASIKGLGIATAHKLVDRHRNLGKIINAVNKTKLVVPEGYWDQYKRARLTFRHHIVYDSQTENTVHLMPLGDSAREMENLDFLGVHLPPPVAHGVASGRLNPKTHEPYENTLSAESPASGPLAPSRLEGKRHDGVALSHLAGAVKTGGSGLGRNLIVGSERPPSPEVAETNEDLQQRVHRSETERLRHEPSTQPSRSRGLIERPFRESRTALAELQFLLGDTPHQAPMAWAQQDEAQPQYHEPEQRDDLHEYGISSTTPDHDEDGRERVRLCADRPSSVPARAGFPPEYSGRQIRSAVGLDLMRIREVASPLAPEAFFPNVRTDSQSQVCLPRPSGGASSPSNVTVATALFPLSLPAHRRARIPKHGLFDDLGPRDWREDRVDYRDPLGGHDWSTGSSPNRDSCWRESYADARQPIWGEDYHEEARGSPQEASGRQHNRPPQYCPTLSGEERSARENRGGRETKPTANLFGWSCYAPGVTTSARSEAGPKESEARGAEARGAEAREVELRDTRTSSSVSSDADEVETREAAGPFSLGASIRTDRSKYLPASAHHFQSTQVNPGLETLHRRKRRLGMAPGALRTANVNEDELKVGSVQPTGGQQLPTGQSAAGDPPPDGPWMHQAHDHSTAAVQQSVSDAPIINDNKHSGGLQLFSCSHGSESADKRNCAPVSQSPPQHINGGLLGLSEWGREGQAASSRAFSEPSRRWTAPSTVERNRPTDLPLFRLMEGANDHSLHRRIGSGGSAPRVTKRSRGMDYWDARLMR